MGKVSIHLVTRSVVSDMFCVKVKETHREETHTREEQDFSLHRRKEKLRFSFANILTEHFMLIYFCVKISRNDMMMSRGLVFRISRHKCSQSLKLAKL